MWQYVDANQLSPRVSLTYKPFDGTTFHAGYARNFTPPAQVLAAPTNLALRAGHDAAARRRPATILCCRSARTCSTSASTRRSRDTRPRARHRRLLQDRARPARRRPVRRGLCADRVQLRQGGEHRRRAQGRPTPTAISGSTATLPGQSSIATNIVSNQFLFGADELAFIADQLHLHRPRPGRDRHRPAHPISGTARASPPTMIYGSGLRAGFANTDHVALLRAGQSRHLARVLFPAMSKPTTVRFDVVNLFDSIYEIRDGSRHRRVRAAIRPAPRLLRRYFAEAVAQRIHSSQPHRGSKHEKVHS